MHISEGALSPQIIIPTYVFSVGMVAYCLKKIKQEDIPKVGVMSAIFFLASFIHLPIGPTSIHLILGGLIGALLGFEAFLAIFVALFFQGTLFGFGGLSTLGANSFIIALPSILGFYILRIKINSKFVQRFIWFLVGFVPNMISSILLASILVLNGDEFIHSAYLVFLWGIPLMVIEGIICLFAIEFIQKLKPNLLPQS